MADHAGPVRIAYVEDDAPLRRTLAQRLRFFPDVELVGVVESGEAAVDMLAAMDDRILPQVVLMDIELPGMSGIEATNIVKERWPRVDVLILTVFEDVDRVFQAVRAGASGYLLKDATAGALVGAIVELTNGGAPMSPSIAKRVLAMARGGVVQDGPPTPTLDSLTDRETELLSLLVLDDTEAQIADRLAISPHTVRTHIKNVYKKLHVHSRASAVREALRHNIGGPLGHPDER